MPTCCAASTACARRRSLWWLEWKLKALNSRQPVVAAAGQWMAEQLQSGAGALPVGVQRQVSATSSGVDGLWLVYRIEPMGLERRRLFTAAAHGLCPSAAAHFRSGGGHVRQRLQARPSRFSHQAGLSAWWSCW